VSIDEISLFEGVGPEGSRVGVLLEREQKAPRPSALVETKSGMFPKTGSENSKIYVDSFYVMDLTNNSLQSLVNYRYISQPVQRHKNAGGSHRIIPVNGPRQQVLLDMYN
jgi:hypothetical protein